MRSAGFNWPAEHAKLRTKGLLEHLDLRLAHDASIQTHLASVLHMLRFGSVS